MAMKKAKKKVTDLDVAKLEKRVVEEFDKAAEDDHPFIQTTAENELRVLGDASKIEPIENDEVYIVKFVIPNDQFTEDEMIWFDEDAIVSKNDYTTVYKTEATQEKVTPYNRTYLSMAMVDFLLNFFEFDSETNSAELKTGKDLLRSSVMFYRRDEIVESTKFFIGKLLDLPEELTPFIHELDLIEIACSLIKHNPSLGNEAYFTAK